MLKERREARRVKTMASRAGAPTSYQKDLAGFVTQSKPFITVDQL